MNRIIPELLKTGWREQERTPGEARRNSEESPLRIDINMSRSKGILMGLDEVAKGVDLEINKGKNKIITQIGRKVSITHNSFF